MSIPQSLRIILAHAIFALMFTAAGRAEDAVRLREEFPAGYQYRVSVRVEMDGMLSLPPEKGRAASKPLPVTGTSAIDYDERVLAASAEGQVQKTARIYRRIDFERKIGGRAQQNTIRPAVRRLVVLRHKNVEVPFSPDGPLIWNEIDLVRTDVFTPALTGLLPDKPVRPGDRWTASPQAIQELTDMERIAEGQVECRFELITMLAQRRYARVAFAGTVRGVNEDGPNRQQLDGYYLFEIQAPHLGYLYLKGINSLLDKDGKELGKVEGRFVLTRQANTRSADLSEKAWKGIGVEPNADNTLLLYDNPELGVRLLYPRRWRVAGVRGRQLALDETNGSGLLLTLEPAGRVPTGRQFQTEVRDWLQKNQAKVSHMDAVRRLPGAVHELEHFFCDVELAGKRVILDYAVIIQAQGGATLAARLLPADQAVLQEDVARIARSVTITRTIATELKSR
jgi:hypothetical protein